MERKKYEVKKTPIEEYIAKHESLTKVGYYYHSNKAPSRMFDTLEEAQEYKREIEKIETQKVIGEYKIKVAPLDFPMNVIEILGLDYTSCANNIEERLEKIFAERVFTEREKYVFYRRFKDYEKLESVGKKLDITRERVRQIEAKTLRKLKRFANYLELGEYANKLEVIKKECDDYIEKMKSQWTYETAKAFIAEYENNNHEKYTIETKTELEDLDLSIRSWNCLRRSNIYEMWQLLQISEDDLMRIRNMGRKSRNEIVKQLAKHNLRLPSESICRYEGGKFTFVKGENENENM